MDCSNKKGKVDQPCEIIVLIAIRNIASNIHLLSQHTVISRGPLSAYQRNANKMAFRWWPIVVRFYFLTGFLNFASASREGSDEHANAQPRLSRHWSPLCDEYQHLMCRSIFALLALYWTENCTNVKSKKKKNKKNLTNYEHPDENIYFIVWGFDPLTLYNGTYIGTLSHKKSTEGVWLKYNVFMVLIYIFFRSPITYIPCSQDLSGHHFSCLRVCFKTFWSLIHGHLDTNKLDLT